MCRRFYSGTHYKTDKPFRKIAKSYFPQVVIFFCVFTVIILPFYTLI
jgi:hypothetical protein